MKSLIKLSRLLGLFIVFSLSIAAQTSTDLQTILGLPIKEFYQINANVWLNVEYGEDKQLCSVAVTEKHTFTDKQSAFTIIGENRKSEKSANDIYSDIIKNLSPSLKFGKLIKYYGSNVGNCFTRSSTEYENVNTFGSSEVCAYDSPRRSYVIQWKRQECKNTKILMMIW